MIAAIAGCDSARESAPPRAPDASSATTGTTAGTAPTVASAAPMVASAAPTAEPAVPASAPAAAKPRGPGDELLLFHAALRGLEKRARTTHARVMWLGDSHGASDLWSGALRMALQKRFGNAGPGFVHVGNKLFRHDGTKITVDGAWGMRPKVPAVTTPTGTGVFGLGGVVVAGARGASTSLAITDAALPSKLLWDVCHRLPTNDERIEVALSTGAKQTLAASAASPPGPLRHASFTSDGAGPTLTITVAAGVPELCGVVVETDPATSPGVVVDTLGINGARLATPLAWNEAAWTAEVARRPPDLVVFEYGTNESGDTGVDTAIYTQQMTSLIGRIRKVHPNFDCVALAPTDRVDTPERTPLVRDGMKAAAAANGCLFWDTYAIMGGKGSLLKWSGESPPRASRDGVHLVTKGYRELGFKLAEDLLARYAP